MCELLNAILALSQLSYSPKSPANRVYLILERFLPMATVNALAKRFFSWSERTLKPGSHGNYLRYITEFLKKHGRKQTGKMRKAHLVEWGTTWHRVQSVQRLFSWGVENEIIKSNPFSKVKRPRLSMRRRTLTKKEATILLRKCNAEFRRLLFALRESIARPCEIRTAIWENIQRNDMSIDLATSLRSGQCCFAFEDFKTVTQRKDNVFVRMIPINKRLGRLLARILPKQGEPKGTIFLNTEGNRWTRNAIRLAMVRTRKRAKLDSDHRGEKVVCYTFRHTGATAAAIVGVRDKTLSEILGHTTTRCTQRYLHLCQDHLQASILFVEELRKKRKLA